MRIKAGLTPKQTRLAILAYHSLDTSGSAVSMPPQVFADQMACLKDAGIRGLSLRDAVEQRAATGTWPESCVVITFDDGFANVHERGLPVLVQHRFCATVFLVSSYVGRWNEWATPPTGLGRREMMSWSQTRDLAAAGLEVGGHTTTHADLARLGPDQAAEEIILCKQEIEAQLGRRVETFAYPYGRFDAVACSIVAREFRAACTTVLRRASEEPLHRLPRIDMYYVRSPGHMRRLIEGGLDGYLALRRWGRPVRRLFAAKLGPPPYERLG